jgi:hypothetical protein
MWQNGTAIYYVLRNERFMATDLGVTLTSVPLLCTLATYGTLAFEIYFPCLLWHLRTRSLATMLGVVLHGLIAFFMMIYDFHLVFLYAYLLLWPDSDYAAAARWPAIRKFFPVSPMAPVPMAVGPAPAPSGNGTGQPRGSRTPSL